ncbi:MAG: hypothetical protein AAF449_09380, partial [Myxococcota bacterium]
MIRSRSVWARIRRQAYGAAIAFVGASCASVPPVPAPRPDALPDVSWAAYAARAQEVLQRLVTMPTARPKGARRAAADILQAFLRRESVQTQLIDVGDGRWAVWGRVEARDAKGPPIVLISHLDTETINVAAWPAKTPPLTLTVRDGRIWGAGVAAGKGLAVLHATSLAVLASIQGPEARDVHMVALPDALDLSARSLNRVIEAIPAVATATLALAGGGYEIPDWFGDGRRAISVAVGERANVVLQIAAVTRNDEVGPTASERLARALVAIENREKAPRLTPVNRALLTASAVGLSAPQRWLRESELTSAWFVVPELMRRPGLDLQFVDVLEVVRMEAGGAYDIRAPIR